MIDDLEIDQKLGNLREVFRRHPEICMATFGGSMAHGYETSTSDIDVFLIASRLTEDLSAELDRLQGQYDFEVRTEAWLEKQRELLAKYRYSLGIIGSHYDYYDLRFLLRVIQGKNLICRDTTISTLKEIEPHILSQSSIYISGAFANLYQDMVGLRDCGRFEEFFLRGGELILRAAHIAVSAEGPLDLSTKWVLPAIERKDDFYKQHVKDLIRLLSGGFLSSRRSAAFLLGCNALVVASSTGEALILGRNNVSAPSKIELPAIDLCFLGIPNLPTVLNVYDGTVSVYSKSFGASYAYTAIMAIHGGFDESDSTHHVETKDIFPPARAREAVELKQSFGRLQGKDMAFEAW